MDKNSIDQLVASLLNDFTQKAANDGAQSAEDGVSSSVNDMKIMVEQ
jgi:hypothetical protein